jgi:RNA polymerase sigma factor (sigma-70 family)
MTTGMPEDTQLLKRFLLGEQAAFDLLVTRHSRLVLYVCRNVLRDACDVEDAAQAVFLVLAHHARSLTTQKSLSAWIYRVAWHIAMNARTVKARRQRHESEAATMRTKESTQESTDNTNCLIWQELQRLPDELLQPLLLHHIQGLSEKDAAKTLGWNLGTFSSRAHRGREALRQRLERRGIFASAGSFLPMPQSNPMSNLPLSFNHVLADATAKAAVLSARGQNPAGLVSSQAIELTRDCIHMLAVRRMKQFALATGIAVSIGLIFTIAIFNLLDRGMASSSAPIVKTANITKDGPHEPRNLDVPTTLPSPAGPVVNVLGAAPFQAPNRISTLDISPDEKLIAVCYNASDSMSDTGGGATVWDIATGTEVCRIPMAYAKEVHFVSNDELIVQGSSKWRGDPSAFGTVLWDIKKGIELRRVQGRFGLWFYLLPGTRNVVSSYIDHPLSPGRSADDPVLIVDPHESVPEQIVQWNLDSGAITPVTSAVVPLESGFQNEDGALSRDGQRLATLRALSKHNNVKNTFNHYYSIAVWDLSDRKLLWQWPLAEGYYTRTLQWHPNGKQLLIRAFRESTRSSHTLLVDASTGNIDQVMNSMLTAGSDGKSVLTLVHGSIRKIDTETNIEEALAVTQGGGSETEEHADIAQSRGTGRYMAWPAGATPAIYDIIDRKWLSPSGFRYPASWLSYLPDGRLCIHSGECKLIDEIGIQLISIPSLLYYYNCFQHLTFNGGRLLVSPGADNGKAEIWDAYQGNKLGHLTRQRWGAVATLYLSKSGNYALTCGEYDGLIQVHDLKTGAVNFTMQASEKLRFHGDDRKSPIFLEINDCCWSMNDEFIYIADASTGKIMMQDDYDIASLGFTGAFREGKRAFSFRNGEGTLINIAKALDYHATTGTIYLNYEIPKTTKVDGKAAYDTGSACGIFNAADGTFIRKVESPGKDARFSDDGSFLISPIAIVECKSGKLVRAFSDGKNALSPSATLIASVKDQIVRVFDVYTGIEIWQQPLGLPDYASKKIKHICWHPAENQLAISYDDACAVLQIDLFHPKGINTILTPDRVKTLLNTTIQSEREELLNFALFSPDAARILTELSSIQMPSSVSLAMFGLECAAHDAADTRPAREALATLAQYGSSDLLRESAARALRRIKNAVDALELRKRNMATGPAQWPNPETSKPDF